MAASRLRASLWAAARAGIRMRRSRPAAVRDDQAAPPLGQWDRVWKWAMFVCAPLLKNKIGP
jgi:hypothetical protein